MLTSEVLAKVRRIQIRTTKLVNEILAGRYESVFRGQGVEFKEVREYVPGDDIRNIDWNVTARTGIPHVKVLTEERELTIMLVVDASGSQRFGSVTQFKLELSAEVCAVLAFSAIQNNDKVGMVVFTDDVELFLPPRKGRKHGLRVIREVLYHEPKSRMTDLNKALQFLSQILKRKTIIFILSDFYGNDYEKTLRILSRRHDVIACIITDPRELELPDVGLISTIDAETGKEVIIDTANKYLREQYMNRAKAEYERKKKIIYQSGAEFLDIRTDKPYIDELYRFFRARERKSNR
ncbi:MAG TPA: DUF58 domain-containing protein [Candidatus Hydrogenedens sp.]|nr:DUF58 domain-containing protein [Candidatus Hydrogenedens sp.]HOK08051.1 DUF58 domain-containing protein [Candidatus Hydrogenedens sp.]HOL19355.1 DUF58 domain-containing protein [Candidatus Hydrogenedens sp.]HPP57955.1 DUF58 domain-containing protein [Candidatus Hydrogenedens sp.]